MKIDEEQQKKIFSNRRCLIIVCVHFIVSIFVSGINNTDIMLTHTGGGQRPSRLSDKLSSSLIQFMRTGEPNGGGLAEWPRFTAENGETMVINDVCEVQNDPDREARKSLL